MTTNYTPPAQTTQAIDNSPLTPYGEALVEVMQLKASLAASLKEVAELKELYKDTIFRIGALNNSIELRIKTSGERFTDITEASQTKARGV